MRTFLFIVVLLAVAVFGGLYWEDSHFAEPGPAARETVVLIQPGSGLALIASQLEKANVVDSALLFRLAVMRRGDSSRLKAGEYGFPAHASEADVLDMLIKHKALQRKITIPEGYTSAMAAAVVNADPALDGPAVPEPPEGTLLPETYLYERGTTRAQMIERMQQAQNILMSRLWAERQPGLPYKTPREAITMASVVEKETGVPAERGHVARVFLNRMAQGMKLDADPTIIYGLTKGVPLGHPLRVSELQKPNPYSTYQILGLPPGPICNPGRRSLEAALNPPQSNDLYFVANGTGGHAFAATLSEHDKNVAAWRHIEAAQQAANVPGAAAAAAVTAPAPTTAAPATQPAPTHRATHRHRAVHRRHRH